MKKFVGEDFKVLMILNVHAWIYGIKNTFSFDWLDTKFKTWINVAANFVTIFGEAYIHSKMSSINFWDGLKENTLNNIFILGL